MLRIVKDERDNYPKIFEDKEGTIHMVINDHCRYLRIVDLGQGGHIYSAEYTTLNEILNEYSDWKEVQAILTIEK